MPCSLFGSVSSFAGPCLLSLALSAGCSFDRSGPGTGGQLGDGEGSIVDGGGGAGGDGDAAGRIDAQPDPGGEATPDGGRPLDSAKMVSGNCICRTAAIALGSASPRA